MVAFADELSEKIDVAADILGGLLGDDALALLDAAEDEEDAAEGRPENLSPAEKVAAAGRCWAKQLGQAAVVNLWVRGHGASELLLVRPIRAFLESEARRIVTVLPDRLPASWDMAGVWVDRIFDPNVFAAGLKRASREGLARIMLRGALSEWELFRPRRSLDSLSLKKRQPPSSLPPEVIAAINRFLDKTLRKPYWLDIGRRLRGELVETLKEGIRAGTPPQQLAERIHRVLGPDQTFERAIRIARTETTGALNAGAQATRDKLAKEGLIRGKRWWAVLDDATRPAHVAAHGQVVPNHARFIVGGERARFPGDTSLSAENRCNCRCTVLSVTIADELLG